MTLLLAMLLTASAQETPSSSEVVSMTTVDIDVVTFDLPTCDRVRAEYRAPDAARAPKIKVVLHNKSGQMCFYKGLAFAGTLSGTYQSTITNPDGAGFYIPPDGDVELRLFLTPWDTPRDVIRMQIPPESGLVVLEGFTAANAPGAAPVAPPAPPPAADAPKPKPPKGKGSR